MKWNKGKYVKAQHKRTSEWEKKLDQTIFVDKYWIAQPKKYVEYVIEKTYTPDNVSKFNLSNGKEVIIEKKGRFIDQGAATQYVWIRKALEEYQELVFVFIDPKKPFPHARKRKDGTKKTHSEWAELNNFRWYDEEYLLKLKERFNGNDIEVWEYLEKDCNEEQI